MTTSTCENCGGAYHWEWKDAFDKFGFGDGDGQIETGQVCNALEIAGYTVEQNGWSLHNTIIVSIKKDGIEQIPEGTIIGYDEPREYLPRKIVKLLDKEFPATCPSDNGRSS